MSLYSFTNGNIFLIVFNIPCETFGVGITILLLTDGVKVNDVFARKVVLVVRDDEVSTLMSIQNNNTIGNNYFIM